MFLLQILIIFSSLSFLTYGVSYFISPNMKSEFKRFGLEKLGLLTVILEIVGAVGLLVGLQINPILLIASSTFFNSVSFWNQIKRGTVAIPWGTMLNGSGDAGGDMNQLSDLGWSDMRIVQTYVGLGQVCSLILIGFYGFQFLRTTNFRRS